MPNRAGARLHVTHRIALEGTNHAQSNQDGTTLYRTAQSALEGYMTRRDLPRQHITRHCLSPWRATIWRATHDAKPIIAAPAKTGRYNSPWRVSPHVMSMLT